MKKLLILALLFSISGFAQTDQIRVKRLIATESIKLNGEDAFVSDGTYFNMSGRKAYTINGTTTSLLGFTIGGVKAGYIMQDSGAMRLATEGAPKDIVFSPGGVETLRVKHDWTVGIHAPNPRTVLEVGGSITVTDTVPGGVWSGINHGVVNLIRSYQPSNSFMQAIGQNYFIGDSGNITMYALNSTAQASYMIGIGNGSLTSITTGYNNIAIGHGSQGSTTTGWANMSLGMGALARNTTGYFNTAMGDAALTHNTTGAKNTAFGDGSGYGIVSGTDNVAVGEEGLFKLATGSHNIGIGTNALFESIAGADNIAVGSYALRNSLASENVAVGKSALQETVNGSRNVAIGVQSLYLGTDGARNVAAGYGALRNNAGLDNVGIGYETGQNNASGNGNVFLGKMAGAYETGSNSFYLNNADRTNTAGDKANSLLYGVFAAAPANQTLTINALPILSQTSTPASNAACTAGTLTWDASYIYVCTASGAWKRAALTGGY
jgi:hypothetical protein